MQELRCTKHQAPSTKHQAPSTKHRARASLIERLEARSLLSASSGDPVTTEEIFFNETREAVVVSLEAEAMSVTESEASPMLAERVDAAIVSVRQALQTLSHSSFSVEGQVAEGFHNINLAVTSLSQIDAGKLTDVQAAGVVDAYQDVLAVADVMLARSTSGDTGSGDGGAPPPTTQPSEPPTTQPGEGPTTRPTDPGPVPAPPDWDNLNWPDVEAEKQRDWLIRVIEWAKLKIEYLEDRFNLPPSGQPED